MGYHVILAAQADRDLEQIVRFLARRNVAAAERLGHALLDEAFAHSAATARRAGHRADELPAYFASSVVLIYDRIDEAQRSIDVARIWDVRPNPGGFSLP